MSAMMYEFTAIYVQTIFVEAQDEESARETAAEIWGEMETNDGLSCIELRLDGTSKPLD